MLIEQGQRNIASGTHDTDGEKFSPILMLSRPAGPSRSTQGLQRGPWSVLRQAQDRLFDTTAFRGRLKTRRV